jgi:hypothetical protein
MVSSAVPAHAVLLDHGPADPTLTFPIWYRDLNGLAMKECLSTVPSPNAAAIGKPMCFPLNPNPAGFPGNVGPEVFYNAVNVAIGKGGGGFTMSYVAALEGSYLPAGLPVHGTESVFARIRVLANVLVPGTYKVTHPYGVEVFNVSANNLGARAIFFTADVPLGTPMNFDLALNGRIGPWIQWTPDPTFVLTNSAGEQFVADPNVAHTYTGSPFGTNFVRVDGPLGSNLDGLGNDFIQTPLGNVVGQIFTAAIATPVAIKRATYSRDPVKNVIGIDVAASSAPGSLMILTGAGVPSVQMASDTLGNYFSHVEIPATSVLPASITVTNATSNPVNSLSQGLVDLVNVTSATYNTLTRTLSVTGTSSDASVPAPLLTVEGPLGGAMTAGSYSTILAAGVLPPLRVSIISSAGGIDADDVQILPGLSDAKAGAPVAVNDAIVTNENTAISANLAANDTVTAPAAVFQVVVISPPASGTAVPIGINTAVTTYTPNTGFFGADSFQYVLIDTLGNVSNIATVSVTVNFVAVGPTAGSTDFAMIQDQVLPLVGHTTNVAALATASAGTTVDPASVKVTTLPLHGTVTVDALGNVTYTPLLRFVGLDSYQYTISNTAGVASLPATVSIVVEGGAEVLSISKATFSVAKSKWTIVGTTNWAGATLTHTKTTCWVGKGVAVGALIGTAPNDATGKFQLVPPTLTDPPPDATNIFTCQTSNGGVVSAVVQRI